MSTILHHTPHPLLKRLHWTHKRPSPGALAGDYRSAFRGRGVEFDQVVKYSYGDDMRTIDWNVTARRGEPYRKQFIEERELTFHVLFEDGAGMNFGTGIRTRRESALGIFALLAQLCVNNRDRLAVTYIGTEVEWHERAVRGRSSIYALAQRIFDSEPSEWGAIGEERVFKVLRTCLRVLPKHSIFVWISDFAPRQISPQWALLRKKFMCIGIRPDDAWDLQTPKLGVYPVLDPDSGEVMTLDWRQTAVRRRHEKWREAREEYFANLFPSRLDRLSLPPDSEPVQAFYKFLEARRLGGA